MLSCGVRSLVIELFKLGWSDHLEDALGGISALGWKRERKRLCACVCVLQGETVCFVCITGRDCALCVLVV